MKKNSRTRIAAKGQGKAASWVRAPANCVAGIQVGSG